MVKLDDNFAFSADGSVDINQWIKTFSEYFTPEEQEKLKTACVLSQEYGKSVSTPFDDEAACVAYIVAIRCKSYVLTYVSVTVYLTTARHKVGLRAQQNHNIPLAAGRQKSL